MTITPVLRPAPHGEKYVFIRVHDGGNSPKYKSVGCRIKPKDWNKTATTYKENWVRTTNINHREINKKIFDALIRIEKEVEDGGELQTKANRNYGHYMKFLNYCEEHIKLIRNQYTKINVQQGVNKFTQFLEEKDHLFLSFGEINKTLLKEYYNWLLKSNQISTSNTCMGVIRTIYNSAVKDEENKIDIKSNPFENFKYEKHKIKNKGLTLTEFKKFKDYIATTRKRQITKNIFLFQFSQAFRITEALFLQWGELSYDEGQFKLDLFTSKTSQRILRKLNIEVVNLFIYGMDRYYPPIHEQKESIDSQIAELTQQLKTPQELSVEDIFQQITEGATIEDIHQLKQSVEENNKNIHLLQEQINSLNNQWKEIIGGCINELNNTKPKEFTWDRPQIEKIDMDRIDEEQHKRLTRCKTTHNSSLNQIQKATNIHTRISSHVARYTASQFLLESGAELSKISQFLTHANEETTKHYINRLGVDSSELSNILNNKLK